MMLRRDIGSYKALIVALRFCCILSVLCIQANKTIAKTSWVDNDEVMVGIAKEWRIGSNDEGVLIAKINDIDRCEKGNTYILDYQMCQIHVISEAGDYLRSIGREGEGPGEFRRPINTVLLNDDIICVFQVMPSRAVMFSVEGEVIGDHPLPSGEAGNRLIVNGGDISDGGIVLKLGDFMRKGSEISLNTSFVRIDEDGIIKATYWELLRTQNLAKVTYDEKNDAEPIWAVSSDGLFYINYKWDAYRVDVFSSTGEKINTLERDYQHRTRVEDELEGRSGESLTSRDVVGLFPRRNGDVWILTSRGAFDHTPGSIATFDVFNREGRFTRQMLLEGPYKPFRDKFYLTGDYVYIVVNGGSGLGQEDEEVSVTNAAEIEVICLRIK
jgi:hypothetical protein